MGYGTLSAFVLAGGEAIHLKDILWIAADLTALDQGTIDPSRNSPFLSTTARGFRAVAFFTVIELSSHL